MSQEVALSPPEALFTLTTDQWTAPFWESAKRRKLVAPKCAECGTFRMPPTPFCPSCLSQELEWPILSGRGTIYSFSVVRSAIVPQMEGCLPYVPALVEPDDANGVRLITNVVGVPLDRITVGAAVTVVWDERRDGIVVPRFTLVA